MPKVHVTLSSEQHAAVSAEAARTGESMSAVLVRYFIHAWLHDHPEPYPSKEQTEQVRLQREAMEAYPRARELCIRHGHATMAGNPPNDLTIEDYRRQLANIDMVMDPTLDIDTAQANALREFPVA